MIRPRAILPRVPNDPRDSSADCGNCPLGGRRAELGLKPRDWRPVPSELRDTAVLVVGEAPGAEEVKMEPPQPLIGASWFEFRRSLTPLGKDRVHLSIANTICCMPPGASGGGWERLQRSIDVRNREIKRETPDLEEPDYLLKPEVCCRPRLLNEAKRYPNLILLGGKSLRAFATGSILEKQGAPLKVGLLEGTAKDGSSVPSTVTVALADGTPWPRLAHAWRVMPLLHPAFVLRLKRWREFFGIGLARAFRFFEDRLNWREPIVIRAPHRVNAYEMAERIRALHHAKRGSFVVIDVESNYHPQPWGNQENRCRLTGECSRGCVRQSFMEQKLRCVGVGDADVSFTFHLLSVDGETEFFTASERAMILGALRDLWLDPQVLKVGHNFVHAEVLSLSRPEYLGCEPVNYRDSMLDAQFVDSELLLNLQTRVLMYEDSPAWKGDIRENPRSDDELGDYNGIDVCLNARIAPKQWEVVRHRRQEQLVPYAHLVAQMCTNMHRMGLLVDQPRRARWETQLQGEIAKWAGRARELADDPHFNPNSPPQVGKLLFDRFGLEPQEWSDKTGEPSADDDTLVHIYGQQLKPGDPLRDLVRAVRFVRKPVKMFGTYVRPCRPRWMEGGWVWEDGALHAEWRATGAKSGRIAAGDPVSPQTIPGKPPYNLRSMFKPRPGHIFVSCDLDQVELRIFVALSRALGYIEMFRNKWDPHGYVAERAFKHRYTQAPGYVDPRTGKKPKKGSIADRLRDLVKRVVYGLAYGAGVPTLHAQIVSAEDDRGELIYADADQAETQLVYDEIHAFAPQFKAWSEQTMRDWAHYGFVYEPVLGRRRDGADSRGGDEDEVEAGSRELLNHPIQGSAASLMALMLEKIVQRYPWGFAGPYTGIALQTHDSYSLEVPIARAIEVRDALSEDMTMDHPALPGVHITAEAGIESRYGMFYCPYCQGNFDEVMEQFGEKVCKCGWAAEERAWDVAT